MTRHHTPVDPLSSLTFDNRFVRQLPGDHLTTNSRRQVMHACHSLVKPTPVNAPQLVAYSRDVANLLELDDDDCRSQLFAKVFSGNTLLAGMEPFAMCYGGHQFGNWAGQLGDGRAINLGETINSRGERWILQLKGAGPTPYSRRADGLAVLRSSIREFLCSEAMHHLGIPTTRALSLVLTGEEVLRDMFYDGHPAFEPGAVVCRVSPSFLRFGNYEIFAARGDHALLKQLVDYTISTDFPHLDSKDPDRYYQWFAEICQRTAELMVHWLRVGFVHGVMNTDNMSVLGLTIDYGPYGWIDNYDPEWTPNTTDLPGRRYAFFKQPSIALWNLTQLANALVVLMEDTARLQQILESEYHERFLYSYHQTMAAKLGLVEYQAASDKKLFDDLISLITEVETDMTIFFRELAKLNSDDPGSGDRFPQVLRTAHYSPDQLSDDYRHRFGDWMDRYRKRCQTDPQDPATRRQAMNLVNPKYVLRNYLAQIAIDKAEDGDYTRIHELLELLHHPYDEQPDKEERYYQKRPDWARHKPGCSMLS